MKRLLFMLLVIFFKNILIFLALFFIIWMTFLDENSLKRHYQIEQEIITQENKIVNYNLENKKNQSAIELHQTDFLLDLFFCLGIRTSVSDIFFLI